jgi:serpin B
VGQSINAFAEALYSQLQSQPGGSGNLFLSPLSISTALAMTYAGARGETATQMAAALHYMTDANTLAGDFAGLIADLNSAGQGNYALSVADAL